MMGIFIQLNTDSPQRSTHPIGYLVQESGCWEWIGATDSKGYGQLRVNGKLVPAHRFVWERDRGPVPDGMELDHLCRNTRCVRSEHEQPVLHRINVLRGIGPTAQNAAKTECQWGHLFTPENTLVRRGQRGCRACNRIRMRQTRKTA